ncbi:outer membrane beta-barrel protein [Venatoribacter cucullus]|uniref:Outer membrane beta-barrel protein n=2 Tax=Venatoribacter cucullus TaxID=2661630 RepID=A0A9X7V0R5_9GAMM|nr:outer membrane beta-barrel protein [Venatoribacter cucullus]
MKTLLAAAVVAASVPAMAYEAGDMMVKAGVINVNPKSDNIDLGALGKAQIDDNTQLGLTFTYMVSPQIGVEVLAATPFEHDVTLGGAKIASTKHLPPTVSAQYYFMDGASKVQPYVGLGVNYTNFYDVKDTASLGTKDLKDSWGWALSAGVNYDLNEQWLLNAAVWKVDIDSEIEGGAADGADVEIDPVVVMIGGGYKF